jgi:hypothetical protein
VSPNNDPPPYLPLLYDHTVLVAPDADYPEYKGNWGTYPTAAPTAYQVNDVVFPTTPDPYQRVAYRCITAGTSAATEPAWPTPPSPGQIISDGTVEWQTFMNVVPLKAIQLTIRFRDPSSDQVRQLTIRHSLLDAVSP